MMNSKAIPITLAAVLVLAGGCADTTGARYGATDTTTYGAPIYDDIRRPVAYTGYVVDIEPVRVERGFKFGVGSVIGAVAGGLLGSQIGEGAGNTAATIAGAAAGGVAGTAAESRLSTQTASRITVDLQGGGTVTIVQPTDPQLHRGMRVAIVGRGENARVVPA